MFQKVQDPRVGSSLHEQSHAAPLDAMKWCFDLPSRPQSMAVSMLSEKKQCVVCNETPGEGVRENSTYWPHAPECLSRGAGWDIIILLRAESCRTAVVSSQHFWRSRYS